MIRFSTLDDDNPTTVVVGAGDTSQPYTRSEYRDFVWSLLIEVEDIRRGPYLDTADDQKVTIGVGFNVEGNPELMAATLRSLGFDPTEEKEIDGQTRSLRQFMTTAAAGIPNDTLRGTDPDSTTTVLGLMTQALSGIGNGVKVHFSKPRSSGDAYSNFRAITPLRVMRLAHN